VTRQGERAVTARRFPPPWSVEEGETTKKKKEGAYADP
jgi:hypothetical protein